MSVLSLRLDQRACEAYQAVNSNSPNSHDFSHGSDYSGKTASEIRTGERIGFSDNNSLNFWSSSTNANNTNNAWNVNFNNGNVNNNNKTNNNNVRCVR
ncbi:DUF1566 domain-containing protein [bacterium]|nr:DUF1566 domain-containing protein [bacterium]